MTENTINTDVTMRDPAPAGGAKRFRPGDEILGRYVVETELGQGGMGVVYLCLDKVGGVKVAVKGLPPEVSHNSDEMEAVRENFQLVSELQHRNIAGVRILEKDAKTGDYYLVMSYARGVSLKRWLRQHGGKTHRVEQLNVLRQIASVLDYAHNAEPRHVIHRDIKPENVMVDERGDVSVLDFGLAAQVRSSLSRVSQVVTSRSGTPAYKSPEQWLAQAQRAPSDQYSLGVIAYQMFADELPYDSDDIEILKHAVVFDPVPEVQGEGKSVNAVFSKVLAKKPQDRFASCGDFVAALEGAVQEGIHPVAPARKTRLTALLFGALAVGALVGGVWWVRRSQNDVEVVRREEIARQVEVVRPQEESRRLAEERRPADEKRKAKENLLAEERRRTEEAKRAEETRIAKARAAAARQAEREKQAELTRQRAAEEALKRRAEEKRQAEEAKRPETARIAAQKPAEARAKSKDESDPVRRKLCDACCGTGRSLCRECGPVRDRAGNVVCEHGIICTRCSGSGSRNSGFFAEPCSDCRGRGWERHAKCAGSGFLQYACPQCKGVKTIFARSD